MRKHARRGQKAAIYGAGRVYSGVWVLTRSARKCAIGIHYLWKLPPEVLLFKADLTSLRHHIARATLEEKRRCFTFSHESGRYPSRTNIAPTLHSARF